MSVRHAARAAQELGDTAQAIEMADEAMRVAGADGVSGAMALLMGAVVVVAGRAGQPDVILDALSALAAEVARQLRAKQRVAEKRGRA